jgi:hypothetical protein
MYLVIYDGEFFFITSNKERLQKLSKEGLISMKIYSCPEVPKFLQDTDFGIVTSPEELCEGLQEITI